MTARRISRRVALRGGVAAVALTAGAAVGAASVAAEVEPLLAMDRERVRLRDNRHQIEDWCENIEPEAPVCGVMEYRGFLPGGRPVYFRPDSPPAMVIGNVSPELQAEFERQLPGMNARDAQREQWRCETGVVAAEKKADALHDQQWDIQQKMAQTPAISCAGVAIKLRLALDQGYLEDEEAQLINSAIADLDRMAGVS